MVETCHKNEEGVQEYTGPLLLLLLQMLIRLLMVCQYILKNREVAQEINTLHCLTVNQSPTHSMRNVLAGLC